MADQNNPGFSIPTPGSAPDPASSGLGATQIQNELQQVLPGATDTTSSRDMLIAGGIWLVFAIVFFFAKNGYANWLVGKRMPPQKANAAGWWLYILLLNLATAGILAAALHVNLLSAIRYWVPLAAIAVISLILMLVSSRR